MVLARYRERPRRPDPTFGPDAQTLRPNPPARASGRPARWALALAGLGAVALGAVVFYASRPRLTATASPSISAVPAAPAPAEPHVVDASGQIEPPHIAPPTILPPPTLESPVGMDPRDAETASRLANQLREGRTPSESDLDSIDELLQRQPGQTTLVQLAEATYLSLAQRRAQASRPSAAIPLLERAARIVPSSYSIALSLAQGHVDASQWPAAEESCRTAARLKPEAPEAHFLLGFILMRQDRDREAAEALQASLDRRDDPQTRALLAQIEHTRDSQKGMAEQRLIHFHVRYDGDTHDVLGREVLRVLDRHYVTLVETFRHQLETVVPVVLYTNRGYYDATGAPAWSGGAYSHLDGRIALPIGGVGAQLPSDAERALLHELAHAFIHDMGGEAVPREIHEGLAQFVEGERCEGGRFTQNDLRAVANGPGGDVRAFYLMSLCFVESLHGQRGQSGLNDLLESLRETRSPEKSFERVYGRTFSASLAEWQASMKQRYAN